MLRELLLMFVFWLLVLGIIQWIFALLSPKLQPIHLLKSLWKISSLKLYLQQVWKFFRQEILGFVFVFLAFLLYCLSNL